VKAEEYEAAVDALLKAFDLDPTSTIEVKVQPHKVTALVLDLSGLKKGTRPVTKDVVIGRDDAMAEDLAKFNNADPTAVAAALALYDKATKGPTVTHVKKK
jgi:hypothetical protein